MSVRRLAEDQFQPVAFAFNAENTAWAEKTILKYPEGRQQSAVIPLLMRAQEQDGWVTRAAIEKIADMLDMAYIRVMEVATFYTQFQLKPVGTRAHVQVCGTTPCMLRGSEALMDVCRKKIHHDPLHTNESGTLSWEEVECQGACVNAPMVIIFKDAYEDLTPERLEQIIDEFEAGRGAEVKTGPQNDRWFSAPAGGPTTLLGDEANATGSALGNGVGDGASVPPSNAARAKTAADETNPTLNTPATAPAKAEENAKAAEAAAPSGTTEAGAAKPTLDDPNRPQAVARPEKLDDLQMIAGVGPKIEQTLHDLGIFTFAQVAAWDKPQRDWVDGYLNFRGRIDRDDWVRQAKVLAEGGEEEYIKVFGRKPR